MLLANRKDRSNVFLYQHVFDVCLEKRPMDSGGVLAAVMLALQAKDLPLTDKVAFATKKVAFLREHGSLVQIKQARVEHKKYLKLLEQKGVKELKEKLEKDDPDKKKKSSDVKTEKDQSAVKKEEEKVAPATGAQLTPTLTEPPPQRQQLQQQQFPMPCFSAEGERN